MMSFEVEQKFRVAGHAEIRDRLAHLGATSHGEVKQRDIYYAHPARDFSQTDEALRIRRVGEQCCITYKGPKLDTTMKTRREIELSIDSAEQFGELLAALGFTIVAEVTKRRQVMRAQGRRFAVEVALDTIQGLGDFVELEVVAEEAELDAARQEIAQLATQLGLTDNERRSYLELLLAATTNLPPASRALT